MTIRKSLWLPAIAAAALLGASQAAHAGSSFSFGIGFGSRGHHHHHHGSHFHYSYRSYCGPSYYYRPYYRPVVYSSVYYAPSPPVVYTTPVVYTQPAPTYVTPTYSYATPSPVQQTVVYPQPAAPNTAQTVVYTPPPAPSQPASTTSATSGTSTTTFTPPAQAAGDGWALLSTDQARTALDAFATEAERNPGAGLPKLGYALASAVIGDDGKAVWAMRQAIQADPDALNRAQLSAGAHNQVRSAIARYDNRIANGFSRADDLFMVAALRYIEGDYNNADGAVTKAIAQGDADATTSTLKTLIDVKLNRNWKYNYGTSSTTPAAPAPTQPQQPQ